MRAFYITCSLDGSSAQKLVFPSIEGKKDKSVMSKEVGAGQEQSVNPFGI